MNTAPMALHLTPRTLPRWLGPLLIWGSAAITLCLWMGSKVAQQDWFLHNSLYGSKTCALMAVTLMGWILILSTRLQFLERLFEGVDRLYQWHRRLGMLVAILLTLHPLFLAGPRLPDLFAYLGFLVVPYPHPTSDYQVGGNLGALVYWALVVLLVLAHRPTRPYQTWLKRHRWMGAVYLLALGHVALVERDIALYPLLTVWMWSWLLIGALALLLSATARWWNPQALYRVQHIEESGSLVRLDLVPEGPPLKALPGQWVFLESTQIGEKGERHPFSIASARQEEGRLTFGIRVVGPWTQAVPHQERGSLIRVYGPYGLLGESLLNSAQECICIGGGVGITPFLSMWEYAHHPEQRSDGAPLPHLHLFYLVKDRAEALFDPWIRQSAIAGNFHPSAERGASRYHLLVSPPSAPLSLRAIGELAGGLEGKKILLCGPTAMIHAYREQAHDCLLPPDAVCWEAFEWRQD